MDGESMMCALDSGVFSESTLAGAIAYHASKGKSFFSLIETEKSGHVEHTEKLSDGNERKTRAARNAGQLQSMGRVEAPANLAELIAGGFNPAAGLPIEGV